MPTMVSNRMELLDSFRKRLGDDEQFDLLRDLVRVFVGELMSAEVDALCGASHGERSGDRVNQRNGYRARRWDTRAGSMELEIPRLRKGSYFPDWLFDPRRRSERALTSVIAECYLRGVSTRKVDGLVKTLGIEGISKSQVSELAKTLDEAVEEFKARKLDKGPYVYVWLDAMAMRVREGGRVVHASVVIATGITGEGQREILGFEVVTTEDGASWLAFLRGLVSRGLAGVQLVVSDAHAGLKAAIASALPGATWQRCRTHFMRNLLTKVPKSAQDFVATLVRSIFAQPDEASVQAQHARIVEQLATLFVQASGALSDAGPEILAFTTFPKEHWKKIWSNNPQERLNREIRRRTDVVGIFPDRAAVVRLVGSLLMEQNDEWIIARRSITLEGIAKVTGKLVELPNSKKNPTEKNSKKLPAAA